MNIKILVTGWTFDKEHNPISEKFVFDKTHIPELLKNSRSLVNIEIQILMLIDSLDITIDNQKNILKACEEAKEDKIIITHGTSNMEKTASFLWKNIKNKTIVLTGAMIPYTLKNSDASFNVGSAIAFVQTLSYWVYIAMNGKYYNWDNVTKNTKLGLFWEKK